MSLSILGHAADLPDIAPIISPLKQTTEDGQPVKYWINSADGVISLSLDGHTDPLTTYTFGSSAAISLNGVPLFTVDSGKIDFTAGKSLHSTTTTTTATTTITANDDNNNNNNYNNNNNK